MQSLQDGSLTGYNIETAATRVVAIGMSRFANYESKSILTIFAAFLE
jgi:hypothetical protein